MPAGEENEASAAGALRNGSRTKSTSWLSGLAGAVIGGAAALATHVVTPLLGAPAALAVPLCEAPASYVPAGRSWKRPCARRSDGHQERPWARERGSRRDRGCRPPRARPSCPAPVPPSRPGPPVATRPGARARPRRCADQRDRRPRCRRHRPLRPQRRPENPRQRRARPTGPDPPTTTRRAERLARRARRLARRHRLVKGRLSSADCEPLKPPTGRSPSRDRLRRVSFS
jgi:hypothetical protein